MLLIKIPGHLRGQSYHLFVGDNAQETFSLYLPLSTIPIMKLIKLETQ